MRKLRGPMADWTLTNLLLRRLDLHLAGANWQRGGGKSSKRPKPIELPDGKGRGTKPAQSKPADIAERLRNLGLIPPGPDQALPDLNDTGDAEDLTEPWAEPVHPTIV